MKKVIITRKIPLKGLNLIKSNKNIEIIQWNYEEQIPREKLIEMIKANPNVDGILCMLTDKFDKELFEITNPTQLKVISTMSAGCDHIDLKECKARQIKVGNTPHVSNKSVSDLGVGLLLTVARRIIEGVEAAKKGEWTTWKPEWLLGKDVHGSTIGIFGLGEIGKTFAKKMHFGFQSKILYHDVIGDVSSAKEFNGKFVSFETLLKESDFIVPFCPLTDSTRHIFNKDAFHLMKKDAIFINISRGGIVNHEDLYEALKNNVILAAGLDVTDPEPLPIDHPLFTLKNCVITPHTGSNTIKSREDMALLAAKNVLNGIEGKKLEYQVVL